MPVKAYPITNHVLDGGVCFLCRRRDDGIGAYLPERGRTPARIVFSCQEHIGLAVGAINMGAKNFDYHDECSMIEGLYSAGEFLDKIGKTDFAQMTQEQMIEFFKAFRSGHEKEMARRLRDHAPPF